MRKNPNSESGVFNIRVLFAFALCSVGALLAMLGFAATVLAKSVQGNKLASREVSRGSSAAVAQQTSTSCASLPGPYRCETWASTYDGTAHKTDAPGDGFLNSRVMATSPDGKVVYVGGTTTNSDGTTNYLVIAVDAATGMQRWVSLYTGSVDLPYAILYALVVSPDGSAVFVTGTRSSFGGAQSAVATVGFASDTGTQLWAALVTELGSTTKDVAISPDASRLYVTGKSTRQDPDGSSHPQAFTVAYGAATGQQLWLAHSAATTGDRVLGNKIVANPDGTRVYVAGGNVRSDGYVADVLLFTYDAATGDLINETHHPTVGVLPGGIVVAPDGSRIFVEEANIETGQNNALTLAYDPAGNELWAVRFQGFCLPSPSINCSSRPWYNEPIAVSPDGSTIFVASLFLYLLNEEGFATVAYDAATGVQKWAARYDMDVADTAVGPSVVVNPTGKEVYIAGFANTADTTTLAYDAATGNQNWVAVYGAVSKLTNAIAVNPDGTQVFVAGVEIQPPRTDADIFALAYNTTTPPLTPSVQLTGVVSRKIHGGAGKFDVDLPLTGPRGHECRSGGTNGDYTMVFTFSKTLAVVGSATTDCGSVGSSMIDSSDAHQYIVNLTGENSCNGGYITVTLHDVIDSDGNTSSTISSPPMALLVGDVTANGIASNTDVAAVKAQVAAPVTASNFRNDVNANGIVSNTDVSITKAQVGTSVP
jgi:PQQ-like domain